MGMGVSSPMMGLLEAGKRMSHEWVVLKGMPKREPRTTTSAEPSSIEKPRDGVIFVRRMPIALHSDDGDGDGMRMAGRGWR